jgi:hypothetical protein
MPSRTATAAADLEQLRFTAQAAPRLNAHELSVKHQPIADRDNAREIFQHRCFALPTATLLAMPTATQKSEWACAADNTHHLAYA